MKKVTLLQAFAKINTIPKGLRFFERSLNVKIIFASNWPHKQSLAYPANLITTTHEEHIKNVFLVECPQTPNTEWIDRFYLMKLKLLADLTTEYNRLTMSRLL